MGFIFSRADTTIETSAGDVPISEIEIGDTVIAYDEETGDYSLTDTSSHEDDAIAYVTIDGEEIETPPSNSILNFDGEVVSSIMAHRDMNKMTKQEFEKLLREVIENLVATAKLQIGGLITSNYLRGVHNSCEYPFDM